MAGDFGIYELSPESMDEQMGKLERAGITHVHWAHDWNYEYMYSRWEMLQIQEIVERHGLRVKGVHASEGNTRGRIINGQSVFINRSRIRGFRKDISSLNEYNRRAGVELVANRIELAALLDAREIVLHLVVPYEDFEKIPGFEERYWAQVFASFDELRPLCAEKGIRIAIENMLATPKKHQYKEFDRLFDRYGREYMGLCYDSGHSLITVGDTEPDWYFLQRYADRLISVHLADNDGIDPSLSGNIDGAAMRSDRHGIPGTGKASWDEICRLIAASPYELPLLLEVVVPKDTAEAEMAGLLEAKAVGEKLTRRIMELRSGGCVQP